MARPFDEDQCAGAAIVVCEDHEARKPSNGVGRGGRAKTGLRLTVLRPTLVYGPGTRGNFLRLLPPGRVAGVPLPLAAVRNRRSLHLRR